MAYGMVLTVAGELSKLKEKVSMTQSIHITNKPFVWFLSSSKNAANGAAQDLPKTKQIASTTPTRLMAAEEEEKENEEDTLSESTVCLLMDRFVPW